jgi:predicted nuclease with TOPRIM domain
MLDNLTPADKYATIKARIDELEAELKLVRDQIIASGAETVTGEFADIKVTLSERASFDQALAKSYLTAEQIAACTKKSVVTTLRVKAKVAEC